MAGVSLLQEETLFILLHIYCHLDTSPTLYNAAATFTRCLVVAIAKPPCLVFGSWHIAHLRVDTGDIDRYPGDSPHGQASMPCFLDRRAAALLARPGSMHEHLHRPHGAAPTGFLGLAPASMPRLGGHHQLVSRTRGGVRPTRVLLSEGQAFLSYVISPSRVVRLPCSPSSRGAWFAAPGGEGGWTRGL